MSEFVWEGCCSSFSLWQGMGSHSKAGGIDLGTSNPHLDSLVVLSSSKGQGRSRLDGQVGGASTSLLLLFGGDTRMCRFSLLILGSFWGLFGTDGARPASVPLGICCGTKCCLRGWI